MCFLSFPRDTVVDIGSKVFVIEALFPHREITKQTNFDGYDSP